MFLDWLLLIFPEDLVNSLGGLFVFLFTLALLASSIVQYLKSQGKIPDGLAGKWSAALSYAMMALTFVIVQVFQLGEQPLRDAEAWVAALMTLITSGFITALLAKLAYLVAKFIGLFKSKSPEPERRTVLISLGGEVKEGSAHKADSEPDASKLAA